MKTRTCPVCKQAGIEASALYPNGTTCRSCGARIEVDAMFNLLLMEALVVLMLLVFNYWNLSVLGIVCAGVLIANAFSNKFLSTHFLPLKHYKNDAGL